MNSIKWANITFSPAPSVLEKPCLSTRWKKRLFEFKVVDIDKTPGTALAQIRQKGYADKFRGNSAEIYLIGVEFDRHQHNITRFEWEQLETD